MATCNINNRNRSMKRDEMTPRERLFAALRGEPTDHVPV